MVLHSVGRDGTLAVHDPSLGEGVGELARDELDKLYTGYAIVLRREHREDILETSAGRRGHWFWSALVANKLVLHTGSARGGAGEYSRADHLDLHYGGL